MNSPEMASGAGERDIGGRSFDVDTIIAQFPLLAAQQGRKRPLAFLDNASTTHKPDCVLAAQHSYSCHYNANVSRGVYSLGKRSTHLYENARGVVADFLSCDAREVVFCAGATEALNTIAYTFGRDVLEPGDEVVLPVYEHHSNIIPWQTIAQAKGAHLKFVFPDEQGHIGEEEWRTALGPRTKIVAVAQVSNVLGSVAPLSLVSRLAHEVGAFVIADCAQSIAHVPVDVRAMEVDFAVFSAHKVYGPMGVGVWYARYDLLKTMEPLMRGGGMVDTVFETRTDFIAPPECFEAGTPNVAGAVGLAEALTFVKTIGFETIRAHEHALLERLLAGLVALPDVEVYGDARHACAGCGSHDEDLRCGVVAFNVKGTEAADVAEALDRDGIAIRAGAHCAEPLVRHLGVQATCRASLALYNTEHDIDRFLEAIEHAKRNVMYLILSTMH